MMICMICSQVKIQIEQLRINRRYTNDKSELTIEEFVKALVRRGIIKVEG